MDDLVSYLVTRIDDIDKKVDNLLKFKWQIIGGSLVGSAFLTILFQLFVILYKK